ncbi:MAG: hypothetical protein GY832_11945, partial [Chloroflexi bacterium]|nr:hypothetical protein [Chloroflexota bacterium]
RIFDGSKRFEYRKAIFKRPVENVIIYATLPVGKVVGEFRIVQVLREDVATLWSLTKDHAGITADFFNAYFSGRQFGHAIEIGKTTEYPEPYSIAERYGVRPPQSFVYVFEED